MIRLVRPSQRYKASYLEALAEHAKLSKEPEKVHEEISAAEYFIVRQQKREASFEAFWLVSDDQYLGTFQLRRQPPNSQFFYDIRPTARRRGYGRILVELAKRTAKARGLWPLVLEADADNAASIHLIRSCGGSDITEDAESDVRRFQFG